MREASRLLAEGLAELAVPDPGRAAPLLEFYMDELERWNPRFGLVKFGSREDLVIRHVLDSLSAWSYVRAAAEGAREPGGPATVLDVGSGAGLPGIPLAVALPGLSFTLLERMARRASFLRTCTLLLGLPRVTVMQRDLGEVSGFFDIVTFRAYAPLSRFLDESRRGGPRWRTLLAYKGRKENAAEELDAVRARFVSAELVTLRTPFLEEERCLVTLTDCPLIDKPVRSG
jgi:16S rRNA (guanine527-N7)-methyltransferase